MLGMAAHTYNLSIQETEAGNAECEATRTHIKTRQVCWPSYNPST